jgi:dsRNA-specific ribonuclease
VAPYSCNDLSQYLHTHYKLGVHGDALLAHTVLRYLRLYVDRSLLQLRAALVSDTHLSYCSYYLF